MKNKFVRAGRIASQPSRLTHILCRHSLLATAEAFPSSVVLLTKGEATEDHVSCALAAGSVKLKKQSRPISGIFGRAAFACILLLAANPALFAQPAAALVRMVTPPSWRGTNVVWNRDVQPHNRIDDTIDNSTNQVFDIVVNFRSCPTASDLSALNSYSTNQMHLSYLSSVALGSVAKSNITQIALMTNVAFVEQQFVFTTNLTVSVPSICATPGSVSCPGSARGLGFDGTGVNIAIIDSGVDVAHAAFTGTHMVGAYNAVGKVFGFNNVPDGNGHGTHVASIALGQATVNEGEGVAPKAGLIVVKIFGVNGQGLWTDAVDGLQTLYQQSQDGLWKVDVVNMSFEHTDINNNNKPIISDGTDAFSQLVNLAESMGMVVVASAGNDGPNNVGLTTPAAATRAITVAASQTQDTTTRADDTIACFSSRGPRTPGNPLNPLDDFKPDVAAPGTHTYDCASMVGIGIVAAQANSGNGAVGMAGTSMAAPHVAGLAALIIQAKPGINAGSVKQLIIASATAPNGNRQKSWQPDSGWGYVNAYYALSAAGLSDVTFWHYPPPVSWESPDIMIYPDPAIIGMPNSATAWIQNRDMFNAAVNVRVQFGVYVFSAATPTFENIGTANIPVLFAGEIQPVSINWTPQAAILGHNCLKVDIDYGLDADFSNNQAQRNINAQQSPITFTVQNTATEYASTVQLIPTFGTNTGGNSNHWTFTLQPTNITLAAADCPITATAQLFPNGSAIPGEKQALQIAAFVNTTSGPVNIGGVTVTATQTNLPTTNAVMTVYNVTKSGATPDEAVALANFLNINTNYLFLYNGEVSFVNPSNWPPVPTLPVTNSMAISNLMADTDNPYPAIPIRFEQLDFNTISNLKVMDTNDAISWTAAALAYANLVPQLGTPMAGHARLNAFWSNDVNVVVSNNANLDTEVSYAFTDAAGYPLVGPGAQVQVAYTTNGNVTRLVYTAPLLTAGPSVQIISSNVAIARATAVLDPSGTLHPTLAAKLCYYVPHLTWSNACSSCPPTNLSNIVLPWYAVGGTALATNSMTGQPTTIELLPVMLPATDDTNYVPGISLSVSTNLAGQVLAHISVSGGMAPYSYQWAASSTALSDSVGPSVTYTPVFRAAPPTLNISAPSNRMSTISWADPSAAYILESSSSLLQTNWAPVGGTVQTNNGLRSMTVSVLSPQAQFFRLRLASQSVAQTETVAVTVIDGNGVSLQAVQTLTVHAFPFGTLVFRPTNTNSWGTESPYDPGLGAQDRSDWRTGMRQPGGGFERFTWTGPMSWKLDFIEEPAGWDQNEVDNADMVFYVGHGSPQSITFTAGPGSDPTRLFYNQAPQAWGDTDQEWMCLLSCDVLQYSDNGNLVWNRWGGDFAGLHVLTGFGTLAWAQTGFPAVYTDNLLGWRHFGGVPIPAPPMTVVGAWFSAAAGRQFHPDGTGRAAALGPIGPGGCWNFNDYYWGRGPVGPTIRASQIRGWWYLSQ